MRTIIFIVSTTLASWFFVVSALAHDGVGATHTEETAETPTTAWDEFWEALTTGKPTLNARLRFEGAKIDGFDNSQAMTGRVRLGYKTRAFLGFTAFAEYEHIEAIEEDKYFNLVDTPNTRGETAIADPEDSGINQAWLRWDGPLGTSVTGGRQVLTLDDHRFVGHVGWRQNMQSFDAITVKSSLGTEKLSLTYSYFWDINRIFGNDGPEATRDFDSRSHIVNVSYQLFPWMKATGFAYFLDFSDRDRDDASFNAEIFSTNSYGVRLNGSYALNDSWKIGYAGSYARQSDSGDNPADYDADYFAGELAATYTRLGTIGFGYELLGSDDGNGRFVTPLATLHKFNGWADTFLDNGGPNGLEDFYVFVAPKLPWGFKGRFAFHKFESDEGGDDLGEEYDAVLIRPVNKYLTLLTKLAIYEGDRTNGRSDRYRFWFEANISF